MRMCVNDDVVLQLGLDVWKRLMAEPLKDTIVSLLLAELHKCVASDVCVKLWQHRFT